MILRRKFAVLGLWASGLAAAAAPPDAVRRAMEASIARQAASVEVMRLAIARQRAAAAMAARPQPAESPTPLFTLSWPATNWACDPLPDEQLTPLLQQVAQKEGVDASLLRAVAEEESGFRPCAVSPKGALGLMQLMPATAAQMGLADPFDPGQSLLYGARFLKQLLARFGGDAALALSAYNAGAGRVEQAGGVPPIAETRQYVRQILGKLPLP
jgi:soluble lytic murein transglycosylase-like protein